MFYDSILNNKKNAVVTFHSKKLLSSDKIGHSACTAIFNKQNVPDGVSCIDFNMDFLSLLLQDGLKYLQATDIILIDK